MLEFDITTKENLIQVAKSLGKSMMQFSSAFLLLKGDLGAGKTTLTQEVAKWLGVTEPVQSPTYSLLKSYDLDGGNVLHHLDLYRVKDISELEAAGIVDLMSQGNGYFVVEWPRFLEGVLPFAEKVITCSLSLGDDGQRLLELEE